MKTNLKPNPRIIPVGIAEVLAEFNRREDRLIEKLKPARTIRMNFALAASDATIDEILSAPGAMG
jgi:hypothetical protein